jgi:hypothetical protein
MAMNLDMTYCNGKGCLLKDTCRRYVDGQHIILNKDDGTFQYYFMDNCDPETRELYIGLKF